jgi:mannitol/fructose-specific phosphotransferase system IIA component (Ntr-type)
MPNPKIKLIFTAEQIAPELKGTTAFDVIDELVAHLASIRKILPEAKDGIAQAIKARERSMSTGIGFGVAIPHANSDLIHEPIVVFGRSATGVNFDALDQLPVRLVALLIVPAREKEKHLFTLTAISRLLHNEKVRSALQSAAETELILDILNGRRMLAAA